jgi:hypothetical protein
MIKRRLAAALSLAIFTCSSAYSAQYEVVELPLADKGENNFPAGLTNSGTAIANVSPLLYSVPIDVTQIDFDQQLISDPVTDLGFVPDPETGNFPTIEELLTDPDAAKAGNINLIDYTILRDYLKGSQALVSDKKI